MPGRLGPEDGRYLIRDSAGEPAEVIALETLGAQRARKRLRRGRPVPIESSTATPLSLTRVTVIQPAPLGTRDAAEEWLRSTSADTERSSDLLVSCLMALNRVLDVHRAETQHPYVRDVDVSSLACARLGYGTGDQLVDGRWIAARELPPEAHGRRARVEDIRPQERIAAVLAGREEVDICEGLMLRARADFDQGRERQGAVQLAVAIDALLAAFADQRDEDQRRDLGALDERRATLSSAAESALQGPLSASQLTALQDALKLGERVLRRRRLLR